MLFLKIQHLAIGLNSASNILAKLDHPEEILDLDLDWQLIRKWVDQPFEHFPDLQAFPKLQSLSISSHKIERLQQRNHYPSLQKLDLSYNLLQDCQGIGRFTNLKELDLSFNELIDIESLQFLEKLEVLHLSHNQLESIHALSSLHDLKVLGLSGNRQIKNWELFTELKSLKVLYAKQLYKLSWDSIKYLAQLEELYISFRRGEKIPQMASLKQLHWDLKYIGKGIEIPTFPALTSLSLIKGPHLEHIIGLEKQAQLEVLDLSQNHLKSIPELSALSELKVLKLRDNPIENFEELYGLEQLKKLDIRDTLLDQGSYQKLLEQLPNTQILF